MLTVHVLNNEKVKFQSRVDEANHIRHVASMAVPVASASRKLMLLDVLASDGAPTRI